MSHTALNHHQFSALTNQQGGASRSLSTGALGPSSGYYVSDPGFGLKHPGPSYPAAIQAHHERYADPRSNQYQGTWVEGHGGPREGMTTHVDVTDNVRGRGAALVLGSQRGEKAIYDANRDRDLHMVEGGSRRGGSVVPYRDGSADAPVTLHATPGSPYAAKTRRPKG